MSYPPYACSCCGVANGDMFYDYYAHLGVEPTDREVMEFEAYRRMWHTLREEREKMRRESVTVRRLYRMSDATRAKISATKRRIKLR